MQASPSIVPRRHESGRRPAVRTEGDRGVCEGQIRFSGPQPAVARAIRSVDPSALDPFSALLDCSGGNEQAATEGATADAGSDAGAVDDGSAAA